MISGMAPQSGSFPYMPPPPAGPATPRPGEVVLEISRLLDMPIQEKLLSSELKQYRVRAFDDFNGVPDKDIGSTRELAGMPENFGPMEDMDTETLRLGTEGILRLKSQSPVIHLQVEYAGGFFGNMKIGRCRIARSDGRSREIWPYALSNKNGELVGCGIELKVQEAGGSFSPPSMAGLPPSASFNSMPPRPGSSTPPMGRPMGPSFQTMPPMAMGSGPMPMGSGTPPSPGMPFGRPPTAMGPPFQPGSGPMQPSFHTMPPMGMQGGKGKGKGPPFGNSPPNSPMGTPPFPAGQQPSFQTMPMQTMPPQLQPQMFPNFNTMSPGGGGGQTVKKATQGGRDVTNLLNQLIHANGLANPTNGEMIQQIFASNEELEIMGAGPPMIIRRGAPPPYDLRKLFLHPYDQMVMNDQAGLSQLAMPRTSGFPGRGSFAFPVVALIEIDRIIDIPAPAGDGETEVMLTLERAQGGKQLARAGPFQTDGQGGLRKAQDCQGTLTAKPTLQDLAAGFVEFSITMHYSNGQRGIYGPLIGHTAPFTVSWRPQPMQYVAIFAGRGESQARGGLYLSYRFTQDSPEMTGPAAPEQAKGGSRTDKDSDGANGQSGKFKKGSQDEVLECAALAVEAQNRAVFQRVNLAKRAEELAKDEKEAQNEPKALMWQLPSGYRDWPDLNGLFISMGPNYVAQSAEIGTSICKVYEEETSVYKELTNKAAPEGLGKPETFEDEVRMKQFIYEMTRKDPDEVMTTLRPIICKDVTSIQRDGVRDAANKPSLKIKVHSATNLRMKENFLFGSVQPKVIVEIPGRPSTKWSSKFAFMGGGEDTKSRRWESKVSADGQHVQWNEEGIITGYNYGDDLKISVVDGNWTGFEGSLGEVRLPGADFYPDSFFAQLPLLGADKNKGNANPARGMKGPSILLEVKVIEPLGKAEAWPPYPPQYAPVANLNASDRETQRLANWDIHQVAKLSFADVSSNYNITEDIWGAFETQKSILENNTKMGRPDWQPERVKDECLMA